MITIKVTNENLKFVKSLVDTLEDKLKDLEKIGGKIKRKFDIECDFTGDSEIIKIVYNPSPEEISKYMESLESRNGE